MSETRDYPPPEPGQSVALTRDLPKVSALLYDRVWNHIRWPEVEAEQLLPKEVGTNFGDADAGLRDWAMVGQLLTSSDGGFDPPAPGPLREAMLVDAPDADSKTRAQARLLRPLVARINRLSGRGNEPGIVPVYSSLAARDREYKAGEQEVLAATVVGLRVVDEKHLTWEQVLEFRKDSENRMKHLRLLHWFDKDMPGKSQAFIEDAVRIKLEDYESAIKKHGLQTVAGSVDDLLTPAVAATLGTGQAFPDLSVAAGMVTVALAGAGLVVRIWKRTIDAEGVKAGPHGEVAFVHELKRLAAGSSRGQAESPSE
jgi:hypothetical protein